MPDDDDPLVTREQAQQLLRRISGWDDHRSDDLLASVTFPARRSELIRRGQEFGFSLDHEIDRMGGSP